MEKDSETERKLLVWRTERGSKTRQGSSETGHRRPFCPKLFATGDNRCPVKFYKTFGKHRPDEIKKLEAPFYLAVRRKRRVDDPIWYMCSPLVKIQLGKFLSDAVSAAGLQSGKESCPTTWREKLASGDCLMPIFRKTTLCS